ncbi:Bcr/CflA family drug resistance efflux transporter [Microbacterium sorbitolivorans]|uniref:MFS transporter n=1 Tax=Microbacterium sorbitolivorans TaxID=1867410 RepID=A0A367Y598_9MICO|nr:multidrug effflux MFS transporter [Microbacterium sorbitolivorans]RCK60191.1 MFS transporter [Microbacterium sorbitolivorans]GGF48691.1 Bcr/CflA family drug resistance efflux transporter [Microbacterium sorbitolivorans]
MTTTEPVRTTTTPSQGGGIGTATLIALALLAAVAPFGTDLYLSAFPAMTSDLATSATGVQLSLTAFLVGAGVGQVLFGPWSDRIGRMTPLLTGLVVFIAASVVAVAAGSIEVLVIARLAQGLGGAAGMVIGRAMILDRESGPAAARALNLMMMIGGVAPVIAPLTGSLLADAIGWRGLLAIVGALGVLSLAATLAFVRESRPKAVRVAGTGGSWSGLLSRGYVGPVVAFGFSMAVMMAYISASPFVYQDMIGLSTPMYGLAFAVNAIGLIVATAISSRLTRRFSIRALTAAGLVISLAAVVVILVLTLTGAPAAWLMLPLFLAIAPLGLVFGNATALALSAVPPAATGAASAFLGLLQFVLAGIVAALVGDGSTLPLALTMLASAIIALLGLALGRKRA